MTFLYNIGIYLLLWIADILSLRYPKVKLFCDGQRNLIADIQNAVTHHSPIIWIHCSSAGEFEQASTIVEWYKRERPQYKILLTFFSPNGYMLRKNYEKADWVFYLPADTLSNARRFIAAVKPAKAIFIKYEFWYNYLRELKKNGIETYIVAAIFRPSQYFFQWYGRPFRKILECYTKIFLQDEQSYKLLESIGISRNTAICGDTRFDRVCNTTINNRKFPIIEKFAEDAFTFIAGSTWEPDEEIIADAAKHFPRIKLIIAPHETDKSRIDSVMERFRNFNTVKLSSLNEGYAIHNLHNANVLVIDCVGILSSIYRYGKFAYIGGGFGTGIHNILEPASYNLPVVFGPNHKKFREAKELLAAGGATCIRNKQELYSLLQLYVNTPSAIAERGNICRKYIESNIGATLKIISQIEFKSTTI